MKIRYVVSVHAAELRLVSLNYAMDAGRFAEKHIKKVSLPNLAVKMKSSVHAVVGYKKQINLYRHMYGGKS